MPLAKILAIETTTDVCSVGLIFNNQFFHRFESAPREHTRLLLPMIDSLLKEAGIQLSDLDALACTIGPGSFTGVRIGTAVMQALSFSSGKPVILISTLQAIAQHAYLSKSNSIAYSNLESKQKASPLGQTAVFEMSKKVNASPTEPTSVSEKFENSENCDKVFARLDAGQKEIYGACFAVDEKGIMQAVSKESIMDPHHLILPPGNWVTAEDLPNAESLLYIANAKYQIGDFVSAENVQPVYLDNGQLFKKA